MSDGVMTVEPVGIDVVEVRAGHETTSGAQLVMTISVVLYIVTVTGVGALVMASAVDEASVTGQTVVVSLMTTVV